MWSDQVGQSTTELAAGGALLIDPAAVTAATEPTAILGPAGQLVMASASFSPESGLADPEGVRAADAVLAALSVEAGGLVGAVRDLVVAGRDGQRIFDLFALPLAMKGWWFVTAFDRTVDVGLRNALASSRSRFKELVEVSSDYAWETSADGAISMVTPKGLAGREPRDLLGRQPTFLFDPSAPVPAISPFTTPVPVENVDVWMLRSDGQPLCFEVSAIPLFDRDGAWTGARGVCRDVTQDRKNRAFLAEHRDRDRVFARITSVFRAEADPDDMLRMAASSSTHGFCASGCQILTTPSRAAGARPALEVTASFGKIDERESIRPALDYLQDDATPDAAILRLGRWSLLVARAIYAGRVVGAIMLWRGADRRAWTDSDVQLLRSLAGQVAAAIEQRANYHLLYDASRADPLTGLLNRRGFYEEMTRRLKRMRRDSATAALVYCDLDNFKQVNDVHGHAKGDEALRHTADILRNNSRSTDLVARLGGDEFAVWLDNANESAAISRVQVFLAAAKGLQVYSGSADKPVGMSAGIAVYSSSSAESFNDFMSRADRAMYNAKRKGKGTYALATIGGRA